MSFFEQARADDNVLLVYNRETGHLEEEKVFEKWFMDLFYGTRLGRLFARAILSTKTFSRIYGWLQNRPGSTWKILDFVNKYQIDINEIEKPLSYFKSFNEFFIRRLKPGARPIEMAPDVLISPADGRLQVYKTEMERVLPVKGQGFGLEELLGGSRAVEPWVNGLCVKVRLAPFDYHRFCYVDYGHHGPAVHVGGRFHSVSPLALRQGLRIFQGNDREYMVLKTNNFGQVLHLDIGAMAVGRIHQHFRDGTRFSKGQEKGYFEFGGSTIILLFQPGMVKMDADIIHYSDQDIECLVKYGSRIGKKA